MLCTAHCSGLACYVSASQPVEPKLVLYTIMHVAVRAGEHLYRRLSVGGKYNFGQRTHLYDMLKVYIVLSEEETEKPQNSKQNVF